LILVWYYFVNTQLHVRAGIVTALNAVAAFTSVFLIGFSFVLGPLRNFLPKIFNPWLDSRKDFGLFGYGFAALHLILVLFLTISETEAISLGVAASMAFAGMAFVIFTLMALTSTASWMKTLGYENWKDLQRLGYLAFAFVLLHITLIGNGVFWTRITGQIAMAFILFALFIRAVSQIFDNRAKEKIQV
ncbi:MAG: ferric reductase-like transmembrane domain-containing protein, partial [Candidatus Diapherotrites archaeon]|nr:ferric reductase-like transmembrane domain-containing protein [Candidatus Diapherotrites archaeon]